MVAAVFSVLGGLVVVVAITGLTGWFVAQEFGYMAVDRARLRTRAAAGDAAAARAIAVTDRTSFMLSGAQLGITVTGLLVGYVAEPLIGEGLATLLGGAGVPDGVGLAVGAVAALTVATVVQMVAGELFPKNLAIARPETVARRLARSTTVYLRVFGWLIRLFDAAANRLVRALGIEPVHDVEHAATPRDLEAIIDSSRASGDLDAELSTLLDRGLDFAERTARAAMVPRPRVATLAADTPVDALAGVLQSGHSRLPVLGPAGDEVLGIVCLRDVLALPADAGGTVSDLARPPVVVPASLPLPAVLDVLRASGEELACVVDEYGGLAGVITVEDVAEELVGEILDEHGGEDEPATAPGGGWTLDGGLDIDELERLVGADLPRGDYRTVAGLVLDRLQRLPEPGDRIAVGPVVLVVETVERRVPGRVRARVDGVR